MYLYNENDGNSKTRHILPPLGGFTPAPETRKSDLEESYAVCVT